MAILRQSVRTNLQVLNKKAFHSYEKMFHACEMLYSSKRMHQLMCIEIKQSLQTSSFLHVFMYIFHTYRKEFLFLHFKV